MTLGREVDFAMVGVQSFDRTISASQQLFSLSSCKACIRNTIGAVFMLVTACDLLDSLSSGERATKIRSQNASKAVPGLV